MHAHAHQHHHRSADAAVELVRDPVCGMNVDPATGQHRAEHRGETWWFCSGRCREKFAAAPTRYTEGGDARAEPPADPEAIYICPMHLEIRQKGPGTCPICGMAL
ncbi:MAG: YHS domain-containing protein, partial [Geminicoccaceae bacterium]|nr:YHS domain-containing protein [Geminicoccaceae bacterium]